MPGIFISYRREDSSDVAGRIYDHLLARFDQQVFLDLDIPPGVDFVDVLDETVHKCDVLLVVIGRGWLDSKDHQGRRRLDLPDDFVRMEISGALERKVRVIPVLVNGVIMPRAVELPEPLAPLARRQAFEISDRTFRDDVARLIKVIEAAVADCKPPAQVRTAPPPIQRDNAQSSPTRPATDYERYVQSLSKFRRLLLFYKPLRPLGWIVHVLFYLMLLETIFYPMTENASDLGTFFVGAFIILGVIRLGALWVNKPRLRRTIVNSA